MAVKKDAEPTPFMRAIRARREARAGADKAFNQDGVADKLGVTFQTYSDYERGRINISNEKAEQLLAFIIDPAEHDTYRQMEGFPTVERKASEVLAESAARQFQGQPVLALGTLVEAIRTESVTKIQQHKIMGAVEGASINSGALDPTESRLHEIISHLGYSPDQHGVDLFYKEGKEYSERLQHRKADFGQSLFVMRHYDRSSNTLNMPGSHPSHSTAVVTLKQLSEELTSAGAPISDGQLKRLEAGATPPRRIAEAVAAYFGFQGPNRETEFYDRAEELMRLNQAFPRKEVSRPSLSAAQFGRKLKAIRDILDISQEDMSMLDPSIPRGLIADLETGTRKTPLADEMRDRIIATLQLADVGEFDRLGIAAMHVLDTRRKHFGTATNTWREQRLDNMQQDKFGARVKAEYDKLTDPEHFDIALRSYQLEGMIGSWERGTLPEHPMVQRAVINAAGAPGEREFFLLAGIPEQEVGEQSFQLVTDYTDRFYRIMADKVRGDDKLKLSIFAGEQQAAQAPGGWQALADQKDDHGVV